MSEAKNLCFSAEQGDSISLGYSRTVERELAGVARVRHCAGSSRDSVNVRMWLAEPLDQYRTDPRAIFAAIRAAGCSLVAAERELARDAGEEAAQLRLRVRHRRPILDGNPDFLK